MAALRQGTSEDRSAAMTNTLAKRITQASIDAGLFLADKRNTDQNYAYISADQVLTKAGDALARNGVMVLPQIVEILQKEVERPNKSPRIDAHVIFDMLITDGDSDLHARWDGFGSDYVTNDKAVYKAITSGHKYFLMKLLNIGVGNEDGEHETPPAQAMARPENVPMSIEDARQVKITIRGEERFLGEMKINQLDWLIANSKNAQVVEAARMVREIDFQMTAEEDTAAA